MGGQDTFLTGNMTQMSWAWSSATKALFSAPNRGFHVELPDGTSILNYNECFSSKMTDKEIMDCGRRINVDALLAGMQLDFAEDVARGVAALRPKMVILFPPHEMFHVMMGVASKPWTSFAEAAKKTYPQAEILIAEPGAEFDLGKMSIKAEQIYSRAPLMVASKRSQPDRLSGFEYTHLHWGR